MNVLYLGKYRQRFTDVIKLISTDDKSVIELCFGDILIAQYCKRKDIDWIGIDINDYFVQYANKMGFKAFADDLVKTKEIKSSDVCIMIGSLYHFNNDIELVLSKMLQAAPKIIISEPIVNLSSSKGWLGTLSKKLTNAGKGEENFRFNKESIINTLDKYSTLLKFSYRIISIKRDILIEILNERN